METTLVSLVVLPISAFSSTHETASSQTAQMNAPSTTSTAVSPATAPVSNSQSAEQKLATKLHELLKASVYFACDKSVVKPENRDAVNKQLSFIKERKYDMVTLEGNCDERSSSKYNLSLGKRRALAAKRTLLSLGVPAAHIKTVSNGKEKPRLPCHEELCWEENRRVDFVHSVK